ncbi:MAG: hypothetical protein EOO06_09670 [Chitinophagaceae bacterium]|nr:MAG: hypothetical protein EOO06_09670 [Chitinophagaceae bacterium]
MFLQGRPLTTQATPHGILSLEFAASMPAVEAVIETWKESGDTDNELIEVAVDNTRLDFLFLTSYTLFFLAAALQLSLLVKQKALLQLVAVAALLAGLLDVVRRPA